MPDQIQQQTQSKRQGQRRLGDYNNEPCKIVFKMTQIKRQGKVPLLVHKRDMKSAPKAKFNRRP